jgi:hypothetical protein
MSLLDYVFGEIEATFREHPHRFFTEHDIHSQLALIAIRFLEREETLYAKTRDGFVISRVHLNIQHLSGVT